MLESYNIAELGSGHMHQLSRHSDTIQGQQIVFSCITAKYFCVWTPCWLRASNSLQIYRFHKFVFKLSLDATIAVSPALKYRINCMKACLSPTVRTAQWRQNRVKSSSSNKILLYLTVRKYEVSEPNLEISYFTKHLCQKCWI